jgi:polysaccharide chain length determinant protein (PEP-CTERM system associated)
MEELISQIHALAKGAWKYRFLAIATAWAVMIAGTIMIFTLPKQYNAQARVFVDTESILRPLLSGMTTVPNTEQQVSIMSRTLITRPNVEKVIRMVKLDAPSTSAARHEALVQDLMSNIKIAGMAQNDIYTISYTNPDPRVVRDVVQAFLTIFVEGGFGDKKNEADKAISFINEQIANYEGKLVAAETALKEFKLKHVGLLPRQGNDPASRMAETSDNLVQARLALREAEQARAALKREIAAIPPGAMADSPRGGPFLSETEARILAAKKNLDGLRLQYTEQHPDIVAARHLLDQLEASRKQELADRAAGKDMGQGFSPILQQMKMSLAGAEAQVASLRARVDEYNARASHLQQANLEAPAVEQQLAQLNRDYQINKENYEKLVASRESAKLSGELRASTEMMNFRVIDPPTVPQAPTGTNRTRLLSLAFGAALLCGALVGILMSKIRPTFISRANLRDLTGLPVLGTVGLHWTPQQRQRRRHSAIAFGAALGLMVLAYGGLMSPFFTTI